MIITQEQYNTVINGLRVQLELQRAKTQETQAALDLSQEIRETVAESYDKTLDEKDRALKSMESVIRNQDTKLTVVKQVASGADVPPLTMRDPGWSEAYEAVKKLVARAKRVRK